MRSPADNGSVGRGQRLSVISGSQAAAGCELSAGGPWRHKSKVRDEKDLFTTCHMQSYALGNKFENVNSHQ